MIMSYILVSLLFIISFSLPSLQGERINSSNIIQRNDCSHDSECPTWFTCNSSSMCQLVYRARINVWQPDNFHWNIKFDNSKITLSRHSGSTNSSELVVAAYTGNVLGGPWAVDVVTVCRVNLFSGDVAPP